MDSAIETLLGELTLDEKISMLAGADMWHSVPVERLGIPSIRVTDGPNGARGTQPVGGPSSACVPVGVALAATWNTELVAKVGAALGEETRAKGAHILLAPTVNIHRTPLAGRNFECYSEDPHLSARMAVAYINGLQSQGVGACVKHFVCNDSEFQRNSISSEVRERALREIYLPPFEAAVREAGSWTIMSAYNRVNGEWASENQHTLMDILKGEWEFDGLVISDWYGTYTDQVAAGGLDLEMPGPARFMGDKARALVASGRVTESQIDDKVRRLLRTIQRAGAFDHPELGAEQAVDRPEHRQLAREAAGEAIVLLKNEYQLLPIDLEQVNSIAVIGENAKWAQIMAGGSSQVTPHYIVSPLEGIRQMAGDRAKVSYQIGSVSHQSAPLVDPSWLKTAAGDPGLAVTYFGNREFQGEPVHTETQSQISLSLFGDRLSFINYDELSIRVEGTVTPPQSGRYSFTVTASGRTRLLIDDVCQIDSWEQAESMAQNGKVPSVTLPLEGGRAYKTVIEYASVPGDSWRSLSFGCMPPLPDDPLAEAVALARQSDVAVVVVGLTPEYESEGFDRPDLELPGGQTELIQAIAAANPNTIVLINTGSPISMNWLEQVPAAAQVWYGGQEAGNGIADVLFGRRNPSGRLPLTFPKRIQDNPTAINYPGENGKVYYGEDIFVGYRYYDQKLIEPLFPFGYGLSYTEFTYHDIQLEKSDFGPGETIAVTVDIENSGSRAGQEVIQLYLRDTASSLVRPEKELKAFTKVSLEPGERREVTLSFDQKALAFYDPGNGGWVSEKGGFLILVGRSAGDIRLRQRFHWQGEPESAAEEKGRLHTGIALKIIVADPAGKQVLEKHLGDLLNHPQASMAQNMSLEELAAFVPQMLTQELLQAINEELAAVN